MNGAPLLPAAFLAAPIAHRGLHDAGRGIIENSAGAFSAAIAAGYGIECDLRPASGGLPVVFHDKTLDRLIDGHGPIADLTSSSLAHLRYKISGETILTFDGLLALVAGITPLLVEIKSEWDPPDSNFLDAIARDASAYLGPIALMSFDPAVVAGLAERAPTIPRGLVSGSYGETGTGNWWQDRLSEERRTALAEMTEFDAVQASFAAYEVGALPAPATQALRKRAVPVLTWTVRTGLDRQRARLYADAPIFEGFRP